MAGHTCCVVAVIVRWHCSWTSVLWISTFCITHVIVFSTFWLLPTNRD
jgi:hypothetical protein